MKTKPYIFIFLLLGLLSCLPVFSQEEPGAAEKFSPSHSIGIVIAHAHVFEGRDENGNHKSLSLPAWSLDYNYQFHPKWIIGLHTDIIIEKFLVKKWDGEEIERSFPIAPALVGIFKPNKHWGFLFGAGAEFEESESFFLNRAAVEYSAELPGEWEVSGSVGYDIKWNGYDSWMLGIGISKKFGRVKKQG